MEMDAVEGGGGGSLLFKGTGKHGALRKKYILHKTALDLYYFLIPRDKARGKAIDHCGSFSALSGVVGG